MVTRTPGRFPYFQDDHHGVNGDTIRADADDPALNANTIAALSAELHTDSDQIGRQMSGDITAEVQKNPQKVSKDARALAAMGWYAVGLVREFAQCVDVFDTSVNTINVEYNARVAKGTSENPNDIKAELNPRYVDAQSLLDTGAQMVATSFNHPNDPMTVRNLIAGGLIPLSTIVLFPGVKLTTNNITNAILSGDYPADVKRLMVLAAKAKMDPDTALRYYLELNRLSAADRAKLFPDNFLESGLKQPDGTTCGSSSLVVSMMLTHPAYAMKVMLGYDPTTGEKYAAAPDGVDPAAWRFGQEALKMHDKTNSGFWIFHWPKSLGTYPGDLTDEMNHGAGKPGETYHWIPDGDATGLQPDPNKTYDAIVYDVDHDNPIPLYVGDGTFPRHVVLVTGHHGDDLTVYDPSKGGTITVTRQQWNDQDSNLGGNWTKRWFAVMPEQHQPQTVPAEPTPSPTPGPAPTPPPTATSTPTPSPSPAPAPTPTTTPMPSPTGP